MTDNDSEDAGRTVVIKSVNWEEIFRNVQAQDLRYSALDCPITHHLMHLQPLWCLKTFEQKVEYVGKFSG